MNARILLVEDDADLAKIVAVNAAPYQLDVTIVSDGVEGLRRALAEDFMLIILDIGLPSLNGLDICRELRVKRPLLPIVFLTGQTTEADVVIGFEFGADDYITKPFRPRELVARVRALLNRYGRLLLRDTPVDAAVKRATKEEHGSEVSAGAKLALLDPENVTPSAQFGDLHIDFDALKCRRGDREILLTAQEWLLLELFVRNAGRTLGRDVVIECIWGAYSSQYEGLLNRLVHRLRTKVEVDPERPNLLVSMRGIGYRWER